MISGLDRDGAPISHSTLVDLLCWRAAHQPDRLAYTFLADGETEEGHLTFSELDKKARSIGAMLQSMGLEGERALLLYPPSLEYISAFWGCLYAGVVAVPAYPPQHKRSLPRLLSIFSDAGAKVALLRESFGVKMTSMFAEDSTQMAIPVQATDIDFDGFEKKWVQPEIDAETLAFLQYTSGSTGKPKGVMLNHENLLQNMCQIQQGFSVNEGDVGVIWLPPYHDMGLIGGILEPIFSGSPCIVMPPAAFLQRPFRWLQAITKYRGTISGGPNFAYDYCVRKITDEQIQALDLSSWAVAFNGAEPVQSETMERFVAKFSRCGFRKKAFYPCYGLAEATLLVSGIERESDFVRRTFRKLGIEGQQAQVASGDEKNAANLVGCGRSIGEQILKVVHPDTRTECEPGQIGEIWIKGRNIARGYWGNEEESARVFEATISDTGESPFMRTEDLGFFHEGELFITGRIKDIIIIRGVNHYPQDIEHTAGYCHPSLRHGGGAAFSIQVDGEERLVIAHEVEFKENPDINEVASAMRQALSEVHELQIHAIVLVKPGRIPKTSSGKIQRYACRESFLNGSLDAIAEWRLTSDDAIEGQVTASKEDEVYSRQGVLLLEETARLSFITSVLQKQIAKVLHIVPSQIETRHPITSFGLDSIMAIELKNKLETSFDVNIPIAVLIEGISIEGLAARVLNEIAETAEPLPAVTITSGTEEGDFPLSLGQKAMWIQHQMAPASIFNPVYAVRMRTKIDAERFRKIFQQIVDRHPALRTTFVVEGDEPLQRVHKAMDASFELEDASRWSEEELQEHIGAAAHQTFDLQNGQLFRVHLFSVTENEAVLLIAAHHIVVDMWSLAVIVQEVGTLYAGNGASDLLPPIKARYTDYVRWQSDMLSTPDGSKLWNYWEKQLAGELPILSLPTDRPRPAIQTFKGQSKSIHFDVKLTRRLKEISQQHNATLYVTLLAAFKTLLHRYTEQTDIVIGSPTTGRSRAEFLQSVGYFVNPVALRSQIHGELTFSAFLKSTRQTVVDAIEHQDYPLYALVEKLHPVRDLSRTPLFQVMFVYQRAHLLNEEGLSSFSLGAEGAQMNLAGIPLESLPITEQVAPFDMTFMMAEGAEGLGVTVTFNTDLFNTSSIDRFLRHFATLLASIAKNPEECISRLDIFPESELNQVLHHWNSTNAELPPQPCIHELFQDQAERTPDATALTCDGQRLTYRALNERANQLARCLQQTGVGPEVLVGICAERSVEMIVGFLAILKAGGAYLPLDPDYPADRLNFMLRDSHTSVLLTQKKLAGVLPPFSGKIIYLDDDGADYAQESTENLPPSALPDTLAYVIYTSGSTGKPKGVMLAHHGLCNLVQAQIQAFAVKEESKVLQYASLNFDASISEIFMALLSGACLHLAMPEVLHSAPALLQLFKEAKITTVTLPPSLLRVLPPEEASGLQTIISAGEACSKDIAARWSVNRRFLNAYGPTEATIGVTSYLLEAMPVEGTSLPIGRPIANTQLYILDRQMNPVPVGATGELYIGGIGLARGYVNRFDQTADRFVPDPFSGKPGARLYRTGDLAHFLADGNIEFLGRIDDQVKVRGFRIELGEIEAVLSQHPALRDVYVIARSTDHGSGDSRLIAYIVAGKDGIPGANDLRIFLRTKLPEYMIPSDFISLEALPLTHNGKIDRKKLPAPKPKQANAANGSGVPGNEIEHAIAGIWQEVLRLDKVGIYDNFFDLGGHSLNLMQVQLKVKEALKKDITAIDMFSYPTVSAFARFLSQGEDLIPIQQQRLERASKQQAAMSVQRQRMMQRRPMK